MPDRIRVAYWNNIPSPYFTERLSRLSARPGLEVHGIFNVERNPDRSWEVDPGAWGFEAHWAERRGRSWFDPTRTLETLRPDLFVSLYGEPSFALNAPRAARYSRRWALRVVPTFDAWEKRRMIKEGAKRALGWAADGAKVPGPDGRAYAESIGIPSERVWEVQQSIPLDHFRPVGDRATERSLLGIDDHAFVVVYVGRLWEGKGLPVLLDALGELPSGTVSLLLVGDGPMEESLKASEDPRIKVTGFVQRDLLPRLLAAADCLAFPTLGDPFGLVVEECMAVGLPVITSDQMGDAHQRVTDTGAGIVVTEHRGVAWARAIRRMMEPENYRRHKTAAEKAARGVDHAAYVRDFVRFTEGILEAPPRRRRLRLPEGR